MIFILGFVQVVENGTLLLTGRVYVPKSATEEMMDLKDPEECINTCLPLLENDLYKETRIRGYQYRCPTLGPLVQKTFVNFIFRNSFRTLKKCDSSLRNYEIEWNGSFICFIDGMLQTKLLSTRRSLTVPTKIEKIVIDPKLHLKSVEESGKKIVISVSEDAKIIRSDNIHHFFSVYDNLNCHLGVCFIFLLF